MRLGVAFEGGGARCAAELGVLRALARAGVEPYAFAGCGAGAVAAAAGALLLPPEICLARLKGCARRGRVRLLALRSALESCFPGEIYGSWRLAVPAADLSTGTARVYASQFPLRPDPRPWSRQAALCEALLAAMSVPGALPPAELRGRQLAGGGMLRALLPALLRALGAERVLCVRVVGAEETRAERSRQAQAVRAATLLSVPPQDADWTLALENKCAPFGVLDTRAMDALFETGYAAAAAALPALWRQEPRPRGKILRFPGMTIEEG